MLPPMSVFFRRKNVEPPSPPPDPEPAPAERDATTTMLVSGDARRDTDRVRLLVETLRAVSAQAETDELLVTMVDRALQTVDAERGLLFVVDDEGRAPLRVARTIDGRDLPRTVSWSSRVVEGVLENGDAVCLRIDETEDFDPSRSMVDLNLRAVMCVPLESADARLGVLYVDTRTTHRTFDKADLRFFQAFADMMAIAWNNRKHMEARLAAARMSHDLALAHDIQVGLLPEKPLELDGYSLSGRVQPADEAGGDYFDFFMTRNGRVAMAVGDVSGHGVGAALVMSAGRAYLRAFCQSCDSPATILRRVNRRLADDTSDEMFMSMFLCVLDPETHQFWYANAGQTRPILLHGRTLEMEDYRVTGLALGVVEETDYEERGPFEFEPGDSIVMFSDGLTELRSGEALYGRDRVKASILQHRELPVARMLHGIVRDALAWTDRRVEDDVTVAILKADG